MRVCGFCLSIVHDGEGHPCDEVADWSPTMDARIRVDGPHTHISGSTDGLPAWFEAARYDAVRGVAQVEISWTTDRPNVLALECSSEQLAQLVEVLSRVLDRAVQVESAIDVVATERRSSRRRS